MSKMFRIGVLSVAMCLGVSAGSLKADFEADLRSVLSLDGRGFAEEIGWDPVHWGRLYDLYKAHKDLYGTFCKDIWDLVKGSEFATKTVLSAEENPDAFAERAFCLLKFSREVYGKVSEYMSSAWDLDEEDAFKDVDALLLSECRYVFVRRLLGFSRFILHRYMRKFGFDAFVDTKDRKPDKKVLAEILKPFAKGDAYKELQLNDNNSQLIQSLHILSKVFDKFFADNGKILKEVKEAFGDSLSSWFGVPTSGNEMDYWEYVLNHSEVLGAALQNLSGDVWGRVERMLSVKEKLSAELKKEALPFFKGEKDVGELLKATESFRIKEKEARKAEQEAFAKAKVERKNLEGEIIEKKKALKTKKDELYKLQESGTEISDKKKELENEIQKLNETVKTLKTEINKLPYPSIKSKHKMQRGAAKEGITKDEHDMAVLANYVQLSDKCGAFQNAFLYYQTIMWNVFTDGVEKMRKYGEKIYMGQNSTVPQLTDDFEEEYYNLAKGI